MKTYITSVNTNAKETKVYVTFMPSFKGNDRETITLYNPDNVKILSEDSITARVRTFLFNKYGKDPKVLDLFNDKVSFGL